MKNPTRALNALNDAPLPADGLAVQPLTLGLAAILEAIGSPLGLGQKPETIDGWAPTLYAFIRPPAASRALLKREGLGAWNRAAQAWADSLPIPHAIAMIKAVTAALDILGGVSLNGPPESDAEGNPTAAGPTVG